MAKLSGSTAYPSTTSLNHHIHSRKRHLRVSFLFFYAPTATKRGRMITAYMPNLKSPGSLGSSILVAVLNSIFTKDVV